MSAITINGDLIHYEKLGRGRPIILLHGWLGSWRYWIPLMQSLHITYSVYTLDLIGFGDSSKNSDHYGISDQTKMVLTLMEQLDIRKAAIIGHGYGALVAMNLARLAPEKVARMMLISMPIFNITTTPADDNISVENFQQYFQFIERMQTQTPTDLLADCFSVTEPEYEKLKTGVEKIDDKVLSGIRKPLQQSMPRSKKTRFSGFVPRFVTDDTDPPRSIREQQTDDSDDEAYQTYQNTPVNETSGSHSQAFQPFPYFDAQTYFNMLRTTTAPTIIIHGENDPVVPVPTHVDLSANEAIKKAMILPQVRHFPMLEVDNFAPFVKDFLSISDLSDVEFAGGISLSNPREQVIEDTRHIFISYSRANIDIRDRVMNVLNEQGVFTWVDQMGIEPGTPSWQKAIQDAIEECKCVIVLLSPTAKESKWVNIELHHADIHGKQIFPIIVEGDEKSSVPFSLAMSQWIDVRQDFHREINKLIKTIKKSDL